jgi:uncharacterized protein (DUF924 family)
VTDNPDTIAPEQKVAPEQVLAFWFSEDAKQHWFKSSDAFDAECRARFGAALDAARAGELDSWGDTPEGALALVILLDQLPRNIYRGTAEAFASDGKALALASDAITSGFDAALPSAMRNFLYLPFMHSERLEDQERGLELFATNDVNDGLRFMKLHHAIIARFGRFPHRNASLGRASTPEELDFLQQPGSSF